MTPEEWEPLKAEVIGRGAVDYDVPYPNEPQWLKLSRQSRMWGYAWVKSGGDQRLATTAAGYDTPANNTAYRLIGKPGPISDQMRAFIGALNDAFKRRDIPPEPPKAEVVIPEIVDPAPISRVVETDEDSDVRSAKRVWRNAAGVRLKDYIKVKTSEDGTTDWEWDIDAIKDAPVGTIKSLSKDGRGRTQVEFNSSTEAAKMLADHYKPKDDTGARVDIRELVVNVLRSGDPAERFRLDDLSKKAAERMKLERQKKALNG